MFNLYKDWLHFLKSEHTIYIWTLYKLVSALFLKSEHTMYIWTVYRLVPALFLISEYTMYMNSLQTGFLYLNIQCIWTLYRLVSALFLKSEYTMYIWTLYRLVSYIWTYNVYMNSLQTGFCTVSVVWSWKKSKWSQHERPAKSAGWEIHDVVFAEMGVGVPLTWWKLLFTGKL